MKPIIGISTHLELDDRHTLSNQYVQAVTEAGGIPILLTPGAMEDTDALARLLDGAVFSGGGDIDPTLFGEEPLPHLGEIVEERDSFELLLIEALMRLDKPILGICRGCQIINIAAGGDMYQDIYTQKEDVQLLQHVQRAKRSHMSHYVQAAENSLLYELAGGEQFKVNSYHHQSVRYVPDPLTVSGVASDGVIEAIESTEHTFVLGVQWHPEELAASGDECSKAIFKKLVDSCERQG